MEPRDTKALLLSEAERLFAEYGKVTIDDDGGATMVVGTSSHGQAHDTAFSMIVSDKLGIPIDNKIFDFRAPDHAPTTGGSN